MTISHEHKFSGKVKRTKPEVSSHCVFCKIAKGEIPAIKIWEDKKYLAFLDMNPINPGHTLLIPKKHTEYIFDLKDNEYKKLMLNTKKIAKLLKEKLQPKRIGIAVEGFFVPHVHVHIVPLNKGNELNPERAKLMDPEELNKIAERIKN
jgi:histidine triad (HIT) family protein